MVTLQDKIQEMAAHQADNRLTIPELVKAFPEVDTEPLVNALLELAANGEAFINRSIITVTVRPRHAAMTR